jgi:hypothetical protein
VATGTIPLLPGAAVLPDGSTGNAAPAMTRVQGTESNPKKHYLALAYDAATDEHAWWTFRMPADYSSAGTVKIQWQANATTATAVRWGVKIGAVTPADADTPNEHATATATTAGSSTNTTEANRLIEVSLDCSANLDSVAAGDLVFLVIYRDADGTSGTDDLAVDASLIAAAFEYTTA